MRLPGNKCCIYIYIYMRYLVQFFKCSLNNKPSFEIYLWTEFRQRKDVEESLDIYIGSVRKI